MFIKILIATALAIIFIIVVLYIMLFHESTNAPSVDNLRKELQEPVVTSDISDSYERSHFIIELDGSGHDVSIKFKNGDKLSIKDGIMNGTIFINDSVQQSYYDKKLEKNDDGNYAISKIGDRIMILGSIKQMTSKDAVIENVSGEGILQTILDGN